MELRNMNTIEDGDENKQQESDSEPISNCDNCMSYYEFIRQMNTIVD